MLRRLLLLLLLSSVFISCDPYEVKLSKDTLIVNDKSYKYNACMINKLNDGVYSVELSGLTDDDIYLKASISIEKPSEDASAKIVDLWLDGTGIYSSYAQANENPEVLNISDNEFNIKATFTDSENALIYKLESSCNVEPGSDYPKVTKGSEKISSNVACSAYEAPDDRMVVITTINYQNNILLLNNISTTVGNEVAFGNKESDGSYHFYYGSLEDNSNIRGDILTLVYDNPLDDDIRYEVECELGKTTRR